MSETAVRKVEQSNRVILWLVIGCLGAILLLAVLSLIGFYIYIRNGRGVTCSTNTIVRALADRANFLIAQHSSHLKVPPLIPAPKGCT